MARTTGTYSAPASSWKPAVEGTDAEKRRAFEQTFRHMMNRVRLFVNLPLKMLDQTAIKRELANIGKTEQEA